MTLWYIDIYIYISINNKNRLFKNRSYLITKWFNEWIKLKLKYAFKFTAFICKNRPTILITQIFIQADAFYDKNVPPPLNKLQLAKIMYNKTIVYGCDTIKAYFRFNIYIYIWYSLACYSTLSSRYIYLYYIIHYALPTLLNFEVLHFWRACDTDYTDVILMSSSFLAIESYETFLKGQSH